jgi:hypothetical protein
MEAIVILLAAFVLYIGLKEEPVPPVVRHR